jgi:hypothetical protein
MFCVPASTKQLWLWLSPIEMVAGPNATVEVTVNSCWQFPNVCEVVDVVIVVVLPPVFGQQPEQHGGPPVKQGVPGQGVQEPGPGAPAAERSSSGSMRMLHIARIASNARPYTPRTLSIDGRIGSTTIKLAFRIKTTRYATPLTSPPGTGGCSPSLPLPRHDDATPAAAAHRHRSRG